MKNITLIILIFILNVQDGFSIFSYNPGDTLFNWAKSGLKIRDNVGFKSKVIETIPFGESLVSIEWKGETGSDEFEILDSYKVEDDKKQTVILKGQWVEIDYKDKTGYVFDAYLSKLSPPKGLSLKELKEFLANEIGVAKTIQALPKGIYVGTERITYNNGAYLKNQIGGSTRTFKLVIPEFSFEEAFLLIHHLSPYKSRIGKRESNSIFIESDCTGYKIKVVEKVTIIIGGSGC